MISTTRPLIDVLCVGHACFDLIFSVDHHPYTDEKMFAQDFNSSGGGPAANAAITASRLGATAAFAGYLGNDVFGDTHQKEFIDNGVDLSLLVRGDNPTPLSSILVKPDGTRALINFKGKTHPLTNRAIDFSRLSFKTVLFDGHEPEVSPELAISCRKQGIPTVLDAGSVHKGTRALMDKVDYLVCSEKFALEFSNSHESALSILSERSATVVITLGEKGLVWKSGHEKGRFPAFKVDACDTTGAGDAFHGAFSVAVATKMNWYETLQFSSAAGALCCTKTGARQGLPTLAELKTFLQCNSS